MTAAHPRPYHPDILLEYLTELGSGSWSRFRDALAAEEFAAALATADRLALGMIEATLVGQELHQRIRGGTFGSSSAWAAGWIWAGCWAVGRVLTSRSWTASSSGVN